MELSKEISKLLNHYIPNLKISPPTNVSKWSCILIIHKIGCKNAFQEKWYQMYIKKLTTHLTNHNSTIGKEKINYYI